MYRAAQLCQKHYFRLWRRGTVDLKGHQPFHVNPKGYRIVKREGHPLAWKNGWVAEHRAVVWERYGQNLPPCEICGKPTDWETCHIDHKDESTDNNDPDNLRPLCPGCNTGRVVRRTIPQLTIDGRTMPLSQWAKEPGVQVTRAQAYRRLKAGWTLAQALFGANKTHPRKRGVGMAEDVLVAQ